MARGEAGSLRRISEKVATICRLDERPKGLRPWLCDEVCAFGVRPCHIGRDKDADLEGTRCQPGPGGCRLFGKFGTGVHVVLRHCPQSLHLFGGQCLAERRLQDRPRLRPVGEQRVERNAAPRRLVPDTHCIAGIAMRAANKLLVSAVSANRRGVSAARLQSMIAAWRLNGKPAFFATAASLTASACARAASFKAVARIAASSAGAVAASGAIRQRQSISGDERAMRRSDAGMGRGAARVGAARRASAPMMKAIIHCLHRTGSG